MFRLFPPVFSINGHYAQLLKEQLDKARALPNTPEAQEALKIDDKNDTDFKRGLMRSLAGLFPSIPNVAIEVYQNVKVAEPGLKVVGRDVVHAAIRLYPYHATINMFKTAVIFAGSPYLIHWREQENKLINNRLPPSERLTDHEVHWKSRSQAFFIVGGFEGIVTAPIALMNLKYSLMKMRNSNHKQSAMKMVQSPLDVWRHMTVHDYVRTCRAALPYFVIKDAYFWHQFIEHKKRGEEFLGIKVNDATNPKTLLEESLLGGFAGVLASFTTYPINMMSRWRLLEPDKPMRTQLYNRWKRRKAEVIEAAIDPKNDKISAYFPRVLQTTYRMITKEFYPLWFLMGPVRTGISMSTLTAGMYLVDKAYDYFNKNNLFAPKANDANLSVDLKSQEDEQIERLQKVNP